MISYDRLSAAAETVSTLLLAAVERDFDPDAIGEPTARFQRKLRSVRRRADHPYFYRSMRQAAGFFLALLVAGSTWFTVDAEAREKIFSWVREIYAEFFVYHFEGNAEITAESRIYRPTWLPNGYSELKTLDNGATVTVVYENSDGDRLTFSYTTDTDNAMWYVDTTDTILLNCTVNGNEAEMMLSSNPKISSFIMWSEDSVSFNLSAFLDKDELVQMAQSVAQK